MKTISWIVAAALGFAAAGCGGSDEISKSEFIKKANAICKTGDAKLQEDTKGLDANAGKDAVISALKDTVIPNIQGQLDDLRDLGYPKGDEDTLKPIYDEAQDDLDKLKDDPEAMLSSTDPFANIKKGFTDYGLTECAN